MSQPIRLLLADDHRMLRETLKRSMVDEGFEIAGEASDGQEAVELVLDVQPEG